MTARNQIKRAAI